MFDINAPIERQRSGSFKLLKIVDSGLDVEYPLAVWCENGRVNTFTRNGQRFVNGPNSPCDLTTLPEPLPLIVAYHNVYVCDGLIGFGCPDMASALRHMNMGCTHVLCSTFDPNTGESSGKTVWRKGESA